MDNPHMGRQLRKLMIDKDVTAKQLAEKLDVSYQAVSQALKKEDLNTKQIRAFAEVMGATFKDVMQA